MKNIATNDYDGDDDNHDDNGDDDDDGGDDNVDDKEAISISLDDSFPTAVVVVIIVVFKSRHSLLFSAQTVELLKV